MGGRQNHKGKKRGKPSREDSTAPSPLPLIEQSAEKINKSDRLFRLFINLCTVFGVVGVVLGGTVIRFIAVIALVLCLPYIAWELRPWLTPFIRTRKRMSLFLFVFCGVIVGGVSGYGLWTYYTKAPSSPGTMPSKEESLAACEELKAEWKPAGLPIEVGPLQAMYFYGIREKNIEYFVYRNDFNFVRHWPTDEQVYPNEMLSTGALNVTNSCALTVYAIEIKIVVEHGKTFSTDNIKIEALRPSKSFTVYFVNQSDAAAHVHLPDAVIAELEGGTGQKSLRMTTKGFYSQVSPLLPEILSPTFHEWKGNVLINPGKAKNNGGMKRQGEQ